jgi:hypothetical protein
LAACPFGPGSTTFTRWVITQGSDPPVFVPWSRIGDISLGGIGGYKEEVEAEYGPEPPYGYKLHGSRVFVGYDGDQVSEIRFSTPYYRTRSGFGVGSRIPLGPCHRTAKSRCEHRWHGFVWNAWVREKPCSCWVKVGDRDRSLPATGANFLKHWVFLDVQHTRVTRIFMAQKFVD